LGSLYIVKHLDNLITVIWQRVLQRSNITQIFHVFFLPTVLAEPLVKFVAVTRHAHSARCATYLTFAYIFLPSASVLLVVVETLAAVAFVAGNSGVGEPARRARHTDTTRLVTDVCDVTVT